MEEQEPVAGRGRTAPKMFEKGALRAQDLNGTRGEPGESLEPARLSEHARREFGTEQGGDVGGSNGGRRFDRLRQGMSGPFDGAE
jgi:hypothetical protein